MAADEAAPKPSEAPSTLAIEAARTADIEFTVQRIGRVRSLEEAAAAFGIEPRDLIKTLVVRRGEDDHVFVLVPGDRTFSWVKVRRLLGTNRISMPDAAAAQEVTGYERGTITPFGSKQACRSSRTGTSSDGPSTSGAARTG
jgi:prolyl-tRNA editing enzyme YbaK/EbsC (Cys-tRNA(Pro) deacylase)